MREDLFVGVTTWNSELFLEHCLRSVRRTTDGLRLRLAVADNLSRDRSVEIARDMGADVHEEHCRQAIALNRLLSKSKARHTLLIHSDVILLSDKWYTTCSGKLVDNIALVSPEDIGCGPLTRPYGAGMPESCFMLFDTDKAKQAREVKFVQRRGIPWPYLRLDLDHYYVTHNLPKVLARRGLSWSAMKVHASPTNSAFTYVPPFTPQYWSDALGSLRYGMGNFYSVDGVITHYHNWYDRVPKDVPIDSIETTEGNGNGLPLAFLSLSTRRFIADLEEGRLVLPSASESQPQPRVVASQVPDLRRPYSAPLSQFTHDDPLS